MKGKILLIVVLFLLPILIFSGGQKEAKEEGAVKLLWWSHWAEEQNKRDVIDTISTDYMKDHPNVQIDRVWWQKKDMWPAIQNTMTARSGFPDIFYFDGNRVSFVDAGWVADLKDGINWDNVHKWAMNEWTKNGKIYALALEAFTVDYYYNVGIFKELGVDVPADLQFTSDEFYDLCKKIRAGGYNPMGQPGTAWMGGVYLAKTLFLNKMGPEKYEQYLQGRIPQNDPDAVEVMRYLEKLHNIPSFQADYSTTSLAEAHTYFHTKQKSAMFVIGSWYTGRAFVPPEKGGQPADFRLSFLHYPLMPDAKGPNNHQLSVGGCMAAAELSPHKDVAIDVLNTFTEEKYANLWVAKTAVQTGLKTNAATMPQTAYEWYFKEYDRTHEGLDMHVHNRTLMGPELTEAWIKVFTEGLPLKLISVEEGIKILEQAKKAAGR